MKKGYFIVIEGADGCGKTTLINALKQHFQDRQDVIFIREPGGTRFGEGVRDLIMNYGDITPQTEMLLFACSRSELVDKVIKPSLNEGKIIICDRFVYSSYAYQGACTSLGVDYVKKVNECALQGLKPDLVIYLNAQQSFRSVDENRLDSVFNDKREQLINCYNQMAKTEGFEQIDVCQNGQEQVFIDALGLIYNLVEQKNLDNVKKDNYKSIKVEKD